MYVYVLFVGHEVDVCKEDCQGTDSANPHYHCPMCKAVYCDRKSIVCHLWRCEVSKEGKHSEGNKDKGKNIKQITEQLEKAYSITSDLPPVAENEEIVVGFKIQLCIFISLSLGIKIYPVCSSHMWFPLT